MIILILKMLTILGILFVGVIQAFWSLQALNTCTSYNPVLVGSDIVGVETLV